MPRPSRKAGFTGVDLCDDAFEAAAKTAKEKGLGNLSFKALDISIVKTLGDFDLVLAFDAVHDQKDPKGMLATIRSSLRQDGAFLMVDIGGSNSSREQQGETCWRRTST